MKSSAAALIAAVIALLIKRSNPELSFALTTLVTAAILLGALHFLDSLRELLSVVNDLIGNAEIYIAPVMKCTAVGMVTKISTELCKDASQSSAAAAIEIAGTVCALGISMPLVLSMLRMLGGLV